MTASVDTENSLDGEAAQTGSELHLAMWAVITDDASHFDLTYFEAEKLALRLGSKYSIMTSAAARRASR